MMAHAVAVTRQRQKDPGYPLKTWGGIDNLMVWLSGASGVPPNTWGGIDDLMLSLRECWQPLRLEQQLQLSMWMLAMLRTMVQCSLGRAIEPWASER